MKEEVRNSAATGQGQIKRQQKEEGSEAVVEVQVEAVRKMRKLFREVRCRF